MFNGANTGFMLLAASLVMLMTPGLAFFYGGLVGRSNTLTIMIQSFASMGITTALWWLVGYSLCFNGGADGVYGNFHLAFLRYVGTRKFVDAAHNVPCIAPGTGLLWFGWYGFNAGSELKVVDITATTYLNTDLAASFAAITWLFVEWWYAKKPHFVGLLTGAVAGLATITPAAGYVPIYASVVIGISAGIVCYYAIQLKNRLRWDEALDVWGVHGMGGLLGIVLLGVFAGTAINPSGAQGLVHGSATFFGKQLAAGIGCSAYAFAFTYVMLKVIDLITPVRVGAEAEEGLDAAMHGESAYELGV